ncbi:MAG: hypothetical protein QNJ90_11085 [Planctomycetota bacterium]|nr:hypothetical protein [Planctomycetota bacterium]
MSHRVFGQCLAALCTCAVLLLGAPALANEKKAEKETPVQPGDTITWSRDVVKAFEKAAAQRKPVMICINSQRVDGGRVEPAAKGLREVVYRDVRIVAKSRQFVCVFLTSAGSSAEYGELRARFGIDGLIVSPQHIFAHPDHKTGDQPLFRKEYWPYGKSEGAVKALLDMMDKSLAAFAAREGGTATPEAPEAKPEPEPDAPDAPVAPEADEKRTAWIQQLLDIVKRGGAAQREEAVRSLVANDRKGDCIDPLVALMPKLFEDKMIPELTTVVRGLTIPGLDKAALIMHEFLKHKDDDLRANTAVTLEYIGSKESIKPLTARVAREKNNDIANHMYRALGRCGKGESKVRSLLLKKAKGSKTETASFGPIVGLAYFEKDAKAARGVEKQLKALGPPGGGRRGGGRGTLKRAMLAWTLSEIGDPKSADFMRERMLAPLENVQSWWKGAVMTYYEAVARSCEGDEEAQDGVTEGVTGTLSFVGGSERFQDERRQGRDKSKFEPKAEWEVQPRDWGGRGGRGNGKGGKGR